MALDKKRTEEKAAREQAEEWKELYRCSLFWLVIGNVYTVITEGFFGLVGSAGLFCWAVNLLSLAGIRFWPNEAGLHYLDGLGREPAGQILLSVVLFLAIGFAAGTFARWGLRGAWAGLLNIVVPAASYQGELQSIRSVKRTGMHGGGWIDWILTFQGKRWAIRRSKSEGREFEKELAPGKEIWVRYLRGGDIHKLWVKSTTKIASHHHPHDGKLRDASHVSSENLKLPPDAPHGSTRTEGAALVRI